MRKLFRYTVSAIAAFLFLIASGLAVFTAETVADEIGYTALIRNLIKNGVSDMFNAGYFELAFYGFLFFAGGAITLWIDYLIRPSTVKVNTKLKIENTIKKKEYMNTEVKVDGNMFVECKFNNVTFIYNGGASGFKNCEFMGYNVTSEISEVNVIFYFLHQLDMLKAPLRSDEGLLPKTGFIHYENDKDHK